MIDITVDDWFVEKAAKAFFIGIPLDYQPQIQSVLDAAEKKGHKLQVRFKLPDRRRSTGPRSQNNRLHGNCAEIAEQIVDSEGNQIYTTEEVKASMLRMSVSEGYPTHLTVDGSEQPKPTRYATIEELSVVFDVINRFCDIHKFWLTEYDEDGNPYRSLGGRTREEMEAISE